MTGHAQRRKRWQCQVVRPPLTPDYFRDALVFRELAKMLPFLRGMSSKVEEKEKPSD